jgi:hypothetical protein
VSRTRSSHTAASSIANFGFKRDTRIIEFASAPLIPKFVSECAARVYELRNRGTSAVSYHVRASPARPPAVSRGVPDCNDRAAGTKAGRDHDASHPGGATWAAPNSRLAIRSPRRRWRAASAERRIAFPHSITSSARTSSDGGTSSPSALAVFRLRAVSYLVGACTGSSAGLAPRRMRSI